MSPLNAGLGEVMRELLVQNVVTKRRAAAKQLNGKLRDPAVLRALDASDEGAWGRLCLGVCGWVKVETAHTSAQRGKKGSSVRLDGNVAATFRLTFQVACGAGGRGAGPVLVDKARRLFGELEGMLEECAAFPLIVVEASQALRLLAGVPAYTARGGPVTLERLLKFYADRLRQPAPDVRPSQLKHSAGASVSTAETRYKVSPGAKGTMRAAASSGPRRCPPGPGSSRPGSTPCRTPPPPPPGPADLPRPPPAPTSTSTSIYLMPRYIKAAHIMHLIIAGFPGPFSWSMRGFMVGFYTDILSNPVEEIRLGGTLLGALNAFLLHEGWDVAFHAPRIHERLNAFLQDAWLKAHDKRLKESLILYSLIQLKVGGLGDRPALRGLEQQLAGALRPLGSRMQHAADSNERSLALRAAQVYSHPLLQEAAEPVAAGSARPRAAKRRKAEAPPPLDKVFEAALKTPETWGPVLCTLLGEVGRRESCGASRARQLAPWLAALARDIAILLNPGEEADSSSACSSQALAWRVRVLCALGRCWDPAAAAAALGSGGRADWDRIFHHVLAWAEAYSGKAAQTSRTAEAEKVLRRLEREVVHFAAVAHAQGLVTPGPLPAGFLGLPALRDWAAPEALLLLLAFPAAQGRVEQCVPDSAAAMRAVVAAIGASASPLDGGGLGRGAGGGGGGDNDRGALLPELLAHGLLATARFPLRVRRVRTLFFRASDLLRWAWLPPDQLEAPIRALDALVASGGEASASDAAEVGARDDGDGAAGPSQEHFFPPLAEDAGAFGPLCETLGAALTARPEQRAEADPQAPVFLLLRTALAAADALRAASAADLVPEAFATAFAPVDGAVRARCDGVLAALRGNLSQRVPGAGGTHLGFGAYAEFLGVLGAAKSSFVGELDLDAAALAGALTGVARHIAVLGDGEADAEMAEAFTSGPGDAELDDRPAPGAELFDDDLDDPEDAPGAAAAPGAAPARASTVDELGQLLACLRGVGALAPRAVLARLEEIVGEALDPPVLARVLGGIRGVVVASCHRPDSVVTAEYAPAVFRHIEQHLQEGAGGDPQHGEAVLLEVFELGRAFLRPSCGLPAFRGAFARFLKARLTDKPSTVVCRTAFLEALAAASLAGDPRGQEEGEALPALLDALLGQLNHESYAVRQTASRAAAEVLARQTGLFERVWEHLYLVFKPGSDKSEVQPEKVQCFETAVLFLSETACLNRVLEPFMLFVLSANLVVQTVGKTDFIRSVIGRIAARLGHRDTAEYFAVHYDFIAWHWVQEDLALAQLRTLEADLRLSECTGLPASLPSTAHFLSGAEAGEGAGGPGREGDGHLEAGGSADGYTLRKVLALVPPLVHQDRWNDLGALCAGLGVGEAAALGVAQPVIVARWIALFGAKQIDAHQLEELMGKLFERLQGNGGGEGDMDDDEYDSIAHMQDVLAEDARAILGNLILSVRTVSGDMLFPGIDALHCKAAVDSLRKIAPDAVSAPPASPWEPGSRFLTPPPSAGLRGAAAV